MPRGAVALFPLLGRLAQRERPATAEAQTTHVERDVGNPEHGEQDQSSGHNLVYALRATTDAWTISVRSRSSNPNRRSLAVVAQLLGFAQVLELLQ